MMVIKKIEERTAKPHWTLYGQPWVVWEWQIIWGKNNARKGV
jgi:hypothetical protein